MYTLVIVTALMGGLIAIFAMIANLQKILSKEHINWCYYVAYGLMALSMLLWTSRGLIGPK